MIFLTFIRFCLKEKCNTSSDFNWRNVIAVSISEKFHFSHANRVTCKTLVIKLSMNWTLVDCRMWTRFVDLAHLTHLVIQPQISAFYYILWLIHVREHDTEIVMCCGCTGLLLTATSLDGVAVNGTLVRFAQRHEHHDSKQPVLVVFSEQNRIRSQQTSDGSGVYVSYFGEVLRTC